MPGSQIAPSTSADATSPLLDVTKFFKHARYHPVAHSRDSRRHVFYGHAEREKPRVLNLEFGPKGPPFTCLGHPNDATEELTYFYAGPHSAPEEPLLIPRSSDAPEGDCSGLDCRSTG